MLRATPSSRMPYAAPRRRIVAHPFFHLIPASWMRRAPEPYRPRLAKSWKTNCDGFRTIALIGLELERYSGMPGVRIRREMTGWDFR